MNDISQLLAEIYIRKVVLKEDNEGGIHIWLDDDRNPNDPKIRQQYNINKHVLWIKSQPDAKKVILSGKVKSIAFDGDLGLFDENGKRAGSGPGLAKWIVDQAEKNKIPRISHTTHSSIKSLNDLIDEYMKKANHFWDIHSL